MQLFSIYVAIMIKKPFLGEYAEPLFCSQELRSVPPLRTVPISLLPPECTLFDISSIDMLT